MLVVFCVDITEPDWAEDIAIRQLIKQSNLMAVATKTDFLSEDVITERLSKLKTLFGCDFVPVSAHSGSGIDNLKTQIAERIIAATSGQNKCASADKYGIALTTRHRQAINNAIHDIVQAKKEIKAGSEELAAMMLRTAYNQLSNIEQHNIDEQILDRIFSRFCIGK
jgi:tRNA modification GTPase